MPQISPSKRKVVLKTINKEFREIHANIPKINRGGCGVFAERTFVMLKKLGFDPKIALLTRKWNRKTSEFGIKNNLGGKLTPFDHIVIVVGRSYIDSTGVHSNINKVADYAKNHVLLKGIPHTLLKSWVREKGHWNTAYKNVRYNAPLRKAIDDVGKKLENIK